VLMLLCGQLSCADGMKLSDTEDKSHRSLRDTDSFLDKNLALGRDAIQSSTAFNGPANLAVDGNKDGQYYDGSCSHTDNKDKAWWAVDLGEETSVGRIRITNRDDGGISAPRLSNFNIGLTNVSPWTSPPQLSESSICKYYAGYPPAGVPTDISCESWTSGRYLFVMLTKAEYLTICELEAYTF